MPTEVRYLFQFMNPYLVSIRRFLREEIMGFLALSALTCVLIPPVFSGGPDGLGLPCPYQWVVGDVPCSGPGWSSALPNPKSALARRPIAVVGGLLGMNILGAPWSLTLPQVGFFTLLVNLFCLYYFAVRGWLR